MGYICNRVKLLLKFRLELFFFVMIFYYYYSFLFCGKADGKGFNDTILYLLLIGK